MAEGVPGSFAYTPSNPTFSQMKNRVARWVLKPNAPEALQVAGECIEEAIDEFNSRMWRMSIAYDDIPLVADDIDYDLLQSFRAAFRAQLYNSDGESVRRLDYLDPILMDEVYPNRSASGSPETYTVWWQKDHGSLLLSAPPATAFVDTYPTLRFWFYQRIQHPTQNADKIAVPPEMNVGILWLARVIIAGQYAENTKKYEIANTHYHRIWRRVVRSDNEIEFRDFNAD